MSDTKALIEAPENAAARAIKDNRLNTPATWGGAAAVRAVLAELYRQGLVIVPKHPTKGMQAACCVLSGDDGEWKPETHQNEFWKAMVVAAPKLVEPKL